MSRIARALPALLATALFACAGPADPAAPADATGDQLSALRPGTAGLTATLSSTRSTFGAADAVTVTLTLHNAGRSAVQLPRWLAATAQLEESLFAVARDGAAVHYIGPDYKRLPPSSDDLVTIAAGQSVSQEISLSGAYDLSATGTYSVRYDVAKVARSNELTLWIEGRQVVEPAADAATVTLGTVSYTRCDATQQSLILQAVSAATTYSSESVSYLSGTPSATARYTTWYGAFSSAGWSKAKNDYAAELDAFQNKPLSFNCGCNQKGVYAFVYSNKPYTIHLCPVFWQVPVSGTDSKGGTLVHEMSHFTVTAGTSDWAYGQSACQSLALSDPTKALDNADSHEYFAENNPALP